MNTFKSISQALGQYARRELSVPELLHVLQLTPVQLHLVNAVLALPESVSSGIRFEDLESETDIEAYWQTYGESVGLLPRAVSPALQLQACHSYERRDGRPVIVEFNSDRGVFYVESLKDVEWYDGSGKHLATEGRAADAQLDLVKEIDRKSYVRAKPAAPQTPSPATDGVCVIAGHRYMRRDGKRVLVQYHDRWDLFYSGPRNDTNWYDLQGKNQSDGRAIADPQRDLIEELEPAEAEIDKSVPAPKAGKYPQMIRGRHYLRRDGVMVQLDYSDADGQWFVENEQEEKYEYDSRGRCWAEDEEGEDNMVSRYDLVRLLTPYQVEDEREKLKGVRDKIQHDAWYPVGVLPVWVKMRPHKSLPGMYQAVERVSAGISIAIGLVWDSSGVCVDCDSEPFDVAAAAIDRNLDLAEGQSSLPTELQEDHWYWVESGSGTTRKRGWLRVTHIKNDNCLFESDALPAVRWNLSGIAFHRKDRGQVRMRSGHINPTLGRETLPDGAKLFSKF